MKAAEIAATEEAALHGARQQEVERAQYIEVAEVLQHQLAAAQRAQGSAVAEARAQMAVAHDEMEEQRSSQTNSDCHVGGLLA